MDGLVRINNGGEYARGRYLYELVPLVAIILEN